MKFIRKKYNGSYVSSEINIIIVIYYNVITSRSNISFITNDYI